MNGFGKLLFLIGMVLMILGAVIWRTGGAGWLGRLPGDISVQKGSSTFYFPIVTCLLLSAVLSLIAWLLRR